MNNDAVLQLVENDNPSVIYEGKRLYGFLKRFFDIFLSLFAIIVLSPLFLVVMFLISIWDKKGHPIFVQNRVGKNGKIFKLYKFRSMCMDAEALK